MGRVAFRFLYSSFAECRHKLASIGRISMMGHICEQGRLADLLGLFYLSPSSFFNDCNDVVSSPPLSFLRMEA